MSVNVMKHFSRMRMLQPISSILLSVAVLTCAVSAEQTDIWRSRADRLMQKELAVNWTVNGKQSEINLVKIEGGQLIFTLSGQAGEASIPMDSLSGIWFGTKENSAYNQAVGQLDSDSFTLQHLKPIRNRAYPRLRFVEIPRENCAFADCIRNYVQGLTQLGHYEEASFIIQQLDVSRLGPDFEEQAIRLALKLTEANQGDAAIPIIKQMDITQVEVTNLDFLIDLAHTIRTKNNFEGARDLYAQIASNPAVTTDEASLWAAYCGIQLGEHIENHDFATQVSVLECGEKAFPLQQLVLGTYYLKREQLKEAMRAVSEGIAFARPTEAWTPELMFRSAQLYERIEMPEIAQSVYQELILFFPASEWAEEAQAVIN